MSCDETRHVCDSLQIVQPVERGFVEVPFLVLCGILHPSSAVRVQWDLYILMLLSSVCILTPYMICFDLQVARLSFLGASLELLSIVSYFYAYRSCLNCTTTYSFAVPKHHSIFTVYSEQVEHTSSDTTEVAVVWCDQFATCMWVCTCHLVS